MFQESKYAHVETMNYKILQRYQDKLYILFPVGGGKKKKERKTFGGKAKKNPESCKDSFKKKHPIRC